MDTAGKTMWCTERGIPRWMALAMFDDVWQVWHLVEHQYRYASPAAKKAALQYELRRLRYEIWDSPRHGPAKPSILRPSKVAQYNGYRYDSERKRAARLRVDPEYRREIATLGAVARIKEA